ncbi:hypothetical protein HII13_001807 [Brettanomyces bruxellensis]|nr:hypothetical protein HII13_001807 [Brettanomyces bruxellensis]
MPSLKDNGRDFDLHTTQGLTKLLRGKSTSLDIIYELSIDLISKKPEYSLPNKDKFIFELLCDRFSQQKFKEFKVCLWIKSELDITTRNARDQVLAKSNIVSSITDALDEIKRTEAFKKSDLVSCISDCIHLVSSYQRIRFSEDQSVSIIGNLLFFASAVPEYDSALLQNIALSVCLIYERSNFHAIKFSKKSVTHFSGACLPNIILLMENSSLESKSLHNRLESIVSDVLFSERNIKDCKDNLGFFINNARAQNKMTKEGLKYIFGLTVHKLGVSDSEDIFKIFISRYPMFSSSLVPLLVLSKNSLNTKFLSNLLKGCLGKSDTNSLNVMKCILSRNSEVGVKFGRSIMNTLIKGKLSDITISVAKSLFQCYVNSRDVEAFVTQWERILPGSNEQNVENVFTSREFAISCSSDFVSLPYGQLEQILKALEYSIKDDPSKCFLPLISICNGLLQGVTGSSSNYMSSALISSLNKLSDYFSKLINDTFKLNTDPRIWELYSYIFMLYELPVLAKKVDIKAIFKCRHEQKNNKFFYVTIFRILEQDSEQFTHRISSSLIKYFESPLCPKSFKFGVFSRWLVLVNTLFRKADILRLVEALFNIDDLKDLEFVFSNPVLHEQSNIVVPIIDHLMESYSVLGTHCLNLVNKIPVFCFQKYQRKQMIDTIVSSSVITEKAEDVIFQLLKLPTSKSLLEIEPKYIIRLFAMLKPNTDISVSLEIATAIFTENLRMENNNYFDQTESLLKTRILDLQNNVFAPYVVIALITSERQIGTIKVHSSRFNDLALLCISNIVNLLSKENLKLADDDIYIFCSILVNFSKFSIVDVNVNIKGMISNLGFNKTHSDKSLNMYIASLSANEEIFMKEWDEVLETYRSRNYEDNNTFIEGLSLLSHFMNNLQKLTSQEHIQIIRGLVLRTLSFAQGINNVLLSTECDEISSFLTTLCTTLTENSWSLNQYSMELIFVLVSKICNLSLTEVNQKADLTTMYIQLTQVVSSILLHQRFRLSGRSHILIFTLTQFMELIFERTGFNNTISSSERCAMSFERLVENYCEPSTTVFTDHIENNENTTGINTFANTQISKIRAELRRSLPLLIMRYLQCFLRYRTSVTVREPLSRSIYLVFKRLSDNELNYVNASLDSQIRPAFKKIYDEYLKFGKWKEE